MKQDEARLQRHAVKFLGYALPPGGAPDYVAWTATLNGIRLTPGMRMKAKAQGLKKGAPDLLFWLPDHTVRGIEMKDGKNGLLPEQKIIRDLMHPDHWALCRSVEDVERTLLSWGIRLRARLSILPPSWLEGEDAREDQA